MNALRAYICLPAHCSPAKPQNEMPAILHTVWPIRTDLNSKSINALYWAVGHVAPFQYYARRLIALNHERNDQCLNDRLHCSIVCWGKLGLKVIWPLTHSKHTPPADKVKVANRRACTSISIRFISAKNSRTGDTYEVSLDGYVQAVDEMLSVCRRRLGTRIET